MNPGPETRMLQAAANAREPAATARSARVAARDPILQVRGPDYEDLLRRAQAARAAAMTALIRHMVAEAAAWLDRLRDQAASVVGARSFSSRS